MTRDPRYDAMRPHVTFDEYGRIVEGAGNQYLYGTDPMHPAHGHPAMPIPRVPPLPPTPGKPETLYSLLASGRPLGRRVWNLIPSPAVLAAGRTVVSAQVDALEVKGPDEAAMNLNVTITPPKVVPITLNGGGSAVMTDAAALAAVQAQNVSGARPP